MKEDKPAVKNSTVKENEPIIENGKKRTKEERPATKIVVRRLPPTMTEEQFKMQVSPLPDIDYFYFVPADMSLSPNAFSRAYLNFVDQTDLFIFTEKFDGYVFVDGKGAEFPAVVEFAPFQRIPKNRPNRKKDPKTGTIEADPVYIAFKERLEAENLENRTAANASKQHFFETSLVPEKKEISNTPLLDFVRNRKAERQRIREEKREEKRKKDLERRKAKEEQRKSKKEEEATAVVKVLNSQSTSKERVKDKEVKANFVKKKSEEIKPTVKEKTTSESRPKETKTRTGKSYLEERQRQAERREEQRKKLSQNQSSNSTNDLKPPSSPEDKPTGEASEEKPAEEKTPLTESKSSKESEYKKSERVFKREEIRRKHDKYESKRDRESDEIRRTRRTNSEKSNQSSRRDDERSEDSGKKRYSESRRSHDATQRDRYKDKEKSRAYGIKKTSSSTTEIDKNKNITENSSKPNTNEITEEKLEIIDGEVDKENELPMSDQNNQTEVSKSNEHLAKEMEHNFEQGAKQKTFDLKDRIKPTRRKSLDCEKSRSSSVYSSSKSYSKDKYYEKKRRNSVGSSRHNRDNTELNPDNTECNSHGDRKDTVDKKIKSSALNKSVSEEKVQENKNDQICSGEFENKSHEEKSTSKAEAEKNEFHEKDRELPKRRNSTGERQVTERTSPRRNSLGSEDKNKICTFKVHKFDSGIISEEDKHQEDKVQRNDRDPRTERRIRNKDRPSREIYRPGMGKYSKQRMEREKGLGSSTEVDSPSSSPSPTPVLKHKSLVLH